VHLFGMFVLVTRAWMLEPKRTTILDSAYILLRLGGGAHSYESVHVHPIFMSAFKRLDRLFFKCPFTKNCWEAIGMHVPTWLKANRAMRRIKRSINKPFAMEVIILMCWSI
jgi:hypothetical protein